MAKTRKASRSGGAAKVLSSRTAFRGRVFNVTSDLVLEPGGARIRRDVVRHNGSVVIMALEERHGGPRVLLVRQYRHAAGTTLWELPAGMIDKGETALTAARRELEEETGYRAREWRRLVTYLPSPGFLAETHSLFLARDLERGPARPDADEHIRMRWFPVKQARRLLLRGPVADGKSLIGLLGLGRR